MSRKYDLKKSAFASLALAFASFGDAFLYPFLPVSHASVGVGAMSVGVLLAINRFVRIFSNSLMVRLFSKYGLRAVMIVAASLAIFSTFGYAIASGLIAWIVLRVCWGLSFSALRIGTLGYAFQSRRPGLSLGVSRSLQELGPALTLFIAPFLLQAFDVRTIFILLAIASLPALIFAAALPRQEVKTPPDRINLFMRFPSVFNCMTLVSAILIDGMVVVVLGILFLHDQPLVAPLVAMAIAAFYLGYRRLCLVLLTPAGGWIADRIGIGTVFNASFVMMMTGVSLLLMGWTVAGVIVVFTFYSINASLTPGAAASGQRSSLAAAAENATWRDVGAAVGTLLGGMLISSPYLMHTLIFATFGLLILFLVHIGTAQRAIKFLNTWK